MNKNSPLAGEDIKAVILDCDGVMFDSAQANSEYYNTVLARFGMPPMDEEQFAYAHMHTGPETFVHLFGNGDKLQEALAAARELTYFPFVRLMRMEPSLMHLLNWLKPRFHAAIATNRTNTMDAVLDEHGLREYFGIVVTSMDVEKPKPDPGQLFKILEFFSLGRRQVLYVGDSSVDQDAARAAGVCFAAFDNPSLEGDVHIRSLLELEDILKQVQES